MIDETVYLGLGGNIGDTPTILTEMVAQLAKTSGIDAVMLSPLYRTTPVSDTPSDHLQRDFINAVCRIKTSMEPLDLFHLLKQLERDKGRIDSTKNAPRIIDIDILFYGNQAIDLPDLQIPHPRWQQRLFVLRPLSDLTSRITLADGQVITIQHLLDNFPHSDQQLWPAETTMNHI